MTETRKSRAGRPRLLTQDRIVDAALRLGLEDFTMKAVAAELGTTIATLYSYVRDRDHLFRLAVDEAMARMPLPTDRGQHWSVFIREFADVAGGALIADRHILGRLIHWGTGLETELRLGEIFVEAMVKRGFAQADALHILRLVGAAAFGTAVRTHCTEARTARGGSLAHAFDEAMSHYAPDELPIIRVAGPGFFDGGRPLLQAMLDPLIERIARQRGEELPDET